MLRRQGPLADDRGRLAPQEVERQQFTGAGTAIGLPIVLQQRSTPGDSCKADFGTWLVSAVNKQWRRVCTEIAQTEECPAGFASTLVSSCPAAEVKEASLNCSDLEHLVHAIIAGTDKLLWSGCFHI